MTRVLIVDDHALIREGLRAVLRSLAEVEVVGEARSGEEALELAEALGPELVLMDVRMPGMGGLAATEALLKLQPAPQVIVLTTVADGETVMGAIRAGARGFILKDMPMAELIAAVRTVAAGRPYLHPEAQRHLAAAARREQPTVRLTEREREVLPFLAEGLSNRQIADMLRMSEKTASVHVSNILRKLDLTSRTHAALYLRQQGGGAFALR